MLVNVDNDTLRRLMANEKAMQALMNIEGFRNLRQEIETIINKSEAVKRVKKESNDRELTREEKERSPKRRSSTRHFASKFKRSSSSLQRASPFLCI